MLEFLECIREITYAQIGWYTFYLFLAIYIPEFIADRIGWERLRPSWVLIQVAAWATAATQRIGHFIGWLSSFVDYVRLEMFYVPFFKLLKPTYDLCISWLWVFTGYVEFADKFKRTGIVYWGSYLIIVIISTCIAYYVHPYYNPEVNIPIILTDGCILGTVISLIFMVIYYFGNAVHEIIKNIWNVINKNNILLVGRSKAAETPIPQTASPSESPKVDASKTTHKKK